jgi:transposase
MEVEALMARFDLTDAEWTIIAQLLPGAEGKKNGRPRPEDRKVLSCIFFVLRAGTRGAISGTLRPYTTVYNRFNRWAKAGIWLRIFEALAAKSSQSLQLIDSSIIRAH